MVPLRCLVLAAVTLSLSCASGGSTTSGDDGYPWGMLAFSRERPPECPYEEVVRLFRDAGIWYRGAPSARGYEGYELLLYGNAQMDGNSRMRRELQKTYLQYEADAFIESVKRGGPTIGPMEYSFIQFTDLGCRE
jgi:hypothetical protein